MQILKKMISLVVDRDYRFIRLADFGIYNHYSDEKYLKRMFKAIMGKSLDLSCPKTFNEKLQWLKLYDRRPEYTMMVDKYLVRDYIAKKLGEEYLIPLLGVWDDPDEIDFDTLPDQFVLKCNHNSGLGMCICKDKTLLNISKVKKDLRKGLRQDYYLTGREWPYKNVQPRIIAEKYMVDPASGELRDYKFQCFNGKLFTVFVCTGRYSSQGVRYHYFDREWNYLPYCPYPDIDVKELQNLKPTNFGKMIEIAEVLSKGILETRIDLYEIEHKIYFGEITFFTSSGFDTDITSESDRLMGQALELPKKNECLARENHLVNY